MSTSIARRTLARRIDKRQPMVLVHKAEPVQEESHCYRCLCNEVKSGTLAMCPCHYLRSILPESHH